MTEFKLGALLTFVGILLTISILTPTLTYACCNVVSNSTTAAAEDGEKDGKDKQQFKCKGCGKYWSVPIAYTTRLWMYRESVEMKHQCDRGCNTEYWDEITLKRHVRFYHEGKASQSSSEFEL